jgi:hypothetical protein
MAGIFDSNGNLTSSALSNISSGVEPLPGGTDLGAGTNVSPLPSNINSLSDAVSVSSTASQPGSPGIFTTTSSNSGSTSTYNFSLDDGTNTAASSALLNSTNLNSQNLPGSLFGVDAGLGQLKVADLTNQSSSQQSSVSANILGNYSTYTYRFTLMMVTPEAYNTIIQNPSAFVPQNVLIASAGLYGNNTFTRNAAFQDDFYFENVEIDTVIGLNSETRGTNAISMKFEVIEPYGCSLLNRLMDATAGLNGYNYLSIPYVFQIDFVGYDNNGNPINPIPGTTKIIPVQLIHMTFNFNEKGTVYKFEAIPINHSSFTETSITIPANFEISATTVKDFFNSVSTQFSGASTQRQETTATATAKQIQSTFGSTNSNQILSTLNVQSTNAGSGTDSTSKTFTVNGISDAYNRWNNYLVDNNSIQVADQIAFSFDSDIAAATITLDETTDIKHTQMLDSKEHQSNSYKVDGAKSSINQSSYTIDYKTNAFRINAGTSIVDLINNILRNSSFVTKQLVDPTASPSNNQNQNTSTTNNNTPYYHWKIVPEVTMLGYDKTRNKYARKITFHITKYKMYNVVYPFAPKGIAANYVKDYQYLFTGQNIDILDLDINFESLYYTAVTAFPSQIQDTSSQAVTDTNQPLVKDKMLPPQGIVNPPSFQPVSSIMSAIAPGHADKDNKTTMAADLMSNLMSKTTDMISVNMTIIGDPDFIKQDDIFFISNKSTLNGSVPMDSGEVVVRLLFKSGGDYDSSTGQLSTATYQANNIVFNGLYKILQVVSNFSDGVFTQKLTMIRYTNQPAYDYKSPSSNNTINSERSSTGYDTPTGTNSTEIGSSVLAGASAASGAISSPTNLVANAVDQLPNLPTPINQGQFTNDFTGPTLDAIESGNGGLGTQPNQLNILVIQNPGNASPGQ